MPSIAQHEYYLTLPQVTAFLDTIAWAEGGKYNILYGGSTFNSYSWHPSIAITAGAYTSTAAGRYQFLRDTWNGIARKLGLRDFSPHNQDIAALELLSERGALSYVINGDLVGALQALGRSGCAWAALPYSRCKQRERSIESTIKYYNSRLGNVNIISQNNNNVNTESVDSDNTLYWVLGIAALALLA